METTPETLAMFFAEHITGSGNQHIILRIVGSAGTGKSWAGIELAVEVSKCVAELKGGNPEDYYSFEKDLAIMGQQEVKRVMTNPGKYHILHLDDVGVAWNARKFNKEFNIDMNDIIQTFRPNNNLVIMTMQSGFLVDKVPRSLAHYEIEMEQTYFNQGFTIAKVNKIVLKHKTGAIHYPYLYLNGCKYKRHIFETPPKEWTDRYEIERSKQLEALNNPPPSLTQETKTYKPLIKDRMLESKRDYDAGVYGDITWKEACKKEGFNYGASLSVIAKYYQK